MVSYLNLEGWSVESIAAELKVTKKTVYQDLKKEEAEQARHSPAVTAAPPSDHRRRLSPEQIAEMVARHKLLGGTDSTKVLAAEYGISGWRVQEYVKAERDRLAQATDPTTNDDEPKKAEPEKVEERPEAEPKAKADPAPPKPDQKPVPKPAQNPEPPTSGQVRPTPSAWSHQRVHGSRRRSAAEAGSVVIARPGSRASDRC